MLRTTAAAKRDSLSDLHQQLVNLGLDKTPRQGDIQEALRRLAPLASKNADSCAVLRDLLVQWPEEPASDPVRTVIKRLGDVKKALGAVNQATQGHLKKALDHAVEGGMVRAHLGMLDELASAREHEKPLTDQAVRDWNRGAEIILERILEHLGSGQQGTSDSSRPEPRPETPTAVRKGVEPQRLERTVADAPLRISSPPMVVQRAPVRLRDAVALDSFLRELRDKLVGIDADAVEIDVTVHPKKGA